MTKKDLVDKVAAGAAIKKTQAEKAIDSFVAAVKESLKSGDRVTVTGFGTFSVVERKARTGRNPRTGKEIKIHILNFGVERVTAKDDIRMLLGNAVFQ